MPKYNINPALVLQKNKDLNYYMTKVYGTTIVCIIITTGLGLYINQHFHISIMKIFWLGVLASFATIFAFNATSRETNVTYDANGNAINENEDPISRKLIFCGFLVAMSMIIAPLLGLLQRQNYLIIPIAICISLLIMVLTHIYSIIKPLGYFDGWKTPLYGSLMALIGIQLINLLLLVFIGSNIISTTLSNIDIYFGLALFICFNIYETQKTIKDYLKGDDDYLKHSLNFFLDFENIFIRIAQIIQKYF